MTFQADFDLVQPDPVPTTGSFLLPLCVTQDELVLIMECVELGGLALGLGRQGEHIAPLWEALSYIDDPENSGCYIQSPPTESEAEIIIKNVTKYVTQSVDENECEIEESMACSKIVKIGGKWYAQLDCGCDESMFFELSPASIDANGDPVSSADGGTVQDSWGFEVGTGNLTCYQANATDYLLNRAVDFAHAVIDFTLNVVDWASNVDETVDTVALLSDMLFQTGDLPAIGALSKNAVQAAMKNVGVGTPLAENWTFTGTVTKSDLYAWVQNAPYFQNSIPVRLILENWIDGSLLIGMNSALRDIAASCESGTSVPDGFPTESELIAGSNVWSHVFDCRDADFATNAYFSYSTEFGTLTGHWVEGVGLVATDNIPATPHANQSLKITFFSGAGAGNLQDLYLDYEYVPNPAAQDSSRNHLIRTVDRGIDTPFNGIYSVSGINNNGDIVIDLDSDRTNNTTISDGGVAIIRRIAIAGDGVDIFSGIAQA